MPTTPRPLGHRLRALSLALPLVLLAVACGSAATGSGAAPGSTDQAAPATQASTEPDTATEAASATDDAEGPATEYPLTIDNCGEEVIFEAAPEQVMLVSSSPVAALQAIGVMDQVVARAGRFPEEYYDDETNEVIAGVPSLGEELDDSGHLQISQEVIIDQRPDLLVGELDGITRESLAGAGIQQLIEPAFCPEGIEDPGFDDVYAQVEFYGELFDRQGEAAESVAGLRDRVESLESELAGAEERTAAVLFPTVGGGAPFAYGTRSMAQPQLEAAGFTNVFGDTDERVFEVTVEELVARDPDVLVLLHVDGEPGPIKDAITGLPGADGLRAVRNDDILVQLFNFTEPPTPLSLDGLERIAEHFATEG